MLTVYVSQTQTSTDNIGDIQSTSYDIASGETKGFCPSGKCLFLRFTHVFIFHIFSSHLPLFSLQSVPCCLDSTTLYRVRAHTHTCYPHYPLTHSLTHTHTHTHTQHTLCEQRTNCCCRGLKLERLQMRVFHSMRMLRGSFCEVLLEAILMASKLLAILRYYNSIKWYLVYPADANWYVFV